MTIAERIKAWREWAGLTKAALARECDVTDVAATYWEAAKDDGGSEPTHRNVKKIAGACGITLPRFWGAPPRGKRRAS